MNREQWLTTATDRLRVGLFAEHGAEVPSNVRVSCSWPSQSIRKRIGEAWSTRACADGTHETYISPIMDDTTMVLGTLVHELVHHVVGTDAGHKAPFKRLAVAVGLEGKMTATTVSDELAERLGVLADELGAYPHGAVDPGQGKKSQTTRLMKCECPECGYVVRTTSKWLDLYGAPFCPCNGSELQQMQES